MSDAANSQACWRQLSSKDKLPGLAKVKMGCLGGGVMAL